MSDDGEVEKQGRKAIDAFVAAVTYPVIWTDSKRLVTLGSAVPFKHGNRHFLLTARHTFDKYDPKTHKEFPYDGLIGPTSMSPRPNTPIMKLGQKKVHTTRGNKAVSRDVIAIELLDESFIKAISMNWQFIGVEDFAIPDRESLYFVGGFPTEREIRVGDKIGASFMSLVTQRHPEVPSDVEQYDKRYDLILDYAKQGVDVHRGNAPTVTPFTAGVSGGPILRHADRKITKVWAPKSALSFVGIQASSTRANQWLRVKNVHAIHRYFDDAIPAIGAAIAKKLGKRH
jgi:hypothetical protein